MKRLFILKIMGREWAFFDDPTLKRKGDWGRCEYHSTDRSRGSILLYSGLEESSRLNTLLHECYHAAFPAFVEYCAEAYGNMSSVYLTACGLERKKSRKVRALRDALFEHSTEHMPYILPSVRRVFTRDLANVLKADGWSLP